MRCNINVIFLLFILFEILFSTEVSAKSTLLSDSQTINNNIDSNGFKQGFWIEYKYKTKKYYDVTNAITIGGGEVIIVEKEDTIYNDFEWFWCGRYQDNQKNGRWIKINDKMQQECVVEFKDGMILYFETYNPDGLKTNVGKYDFELKKMIIQTFDSNNNIIKMEVLDYPIDLFR